ncbi:MAG: hypothetical protein M1826_002888 [Phylliscum demangeonii]|nr:MAG: hypothetical protein M1826_002888 [Phylliscum demangeonii]
MWKRLFLVIFNAEGSKSSVYIIVDGMDEASKKDQEEFLRILRAAERRRPRFSDTDAVPMIEVSARKNSEDIDNYVASSIKKSVTLRKASEALRQEIITQLREGADGMFLWVKLRITEISNKRRPHSIRRALKQMPNGLSAMIFRGGRGHRYLPSLHITPLLSSSAARTWLGQRDSSLLVQGLPTLIGWEMVCHAVALGSVGPRDADDGIESDASSGWAPLEAPDDLPPELRAIVCRVRELEQDQRQALGGGALEDYAALPPARRGGDARCGRGIIGMAILDPEAIEDLNMLLLWVTYAAWPLTLGELDLPRHPRMAEAADTENAQEKFSAVASERHPSIGIQPRDTQRSCFVSSIGGLRALYLALALQSGSEEGFISMEDTLPRQYPSLFTLVREDGNTTEDLQLHAKSESVLALRLRHRGLFTWSSTYDPESRGALPALLNNVRKSRRSVVGTPSINLDMAGMGLNVILSLLRRGFLPTNLALITFYQAQYEAYRAALWAANQAWQGWEFTGIRVKKAVGFQGRRKDADHCSALQHYIDSGICQGPQPIQCGHYLCQRRTHRFTDVMATRSPPKSMARGGQTQEH